jgi:hypothetical protein
MSDSPLILSALFLLDVAPAGKRATRLGIDIIGEFGCVSCAEQTKNESPADGGALHSGKRND